MENPQVESLRLDIGTLTRGFFGILQNQKTGLGTARDKTQHSEINLEIRCLVEKELSTLYRKSGVIQRAVRTYPEDAEQVWVELNLGTSNVKQEDLEEYLSRDRYLEIFNQERKGADVGRRPLGLREVMFRASLEGRWHGDGFGLIFVADGRETKEPIDERNIGSIRGFKFIPRYEIQPWRRAGYAIYEPEYYELLVYDPDEKQQIKESLNTRLNNAVDGRFWHHSRVIRIPGVELDREGLIRNNGFNDSIIQSMFESFCCYYPGIQSASIMVQDHRHEKYGIEGLAKLIKDEEEIEPGKITNREGKNLVQAITDRLILNSLSRSVAKATLFDPKTETWEIDTNQYGGLPETIDKLLEAWTMNTDMSRLLLFNQLGSMGLVSGEAFRFSRQDHAYRLKSWMQRRWRSPLEQVYRLAMLAKDSPAKGKVIKGWKIEFPFSYEMTREEELQEQQLAAQRDTSYIGLGVYSAGEARKQFEGPKFNPNIVLEPGAKAPAEEEGAEEPDQEKEQLQAENQQLQQQLEITNQQLLFFQQRAQFKRTGTLPGSGILPQQQGAGIVPQQQSNQRQDSSDIWELRSLPRNPQTGQVLFLNQWWELNKPVPSDRPDRDKMVLASQQGKVKLVYFGVPQRTDNLSNKEWDAIANINPQDLDDLGADLEQFNNER